MTLAPLQLPLYSLSDEVGAFLTYECPHCKHQFEIELPQ